MFVALDAVGSIDLEATDSWGDYWMKMGASCSSGASFAAFAAGTSYLELVAYKIEELVDTGSFDEGHD